MTKEEALKWLGKQVEDRDWGVGTIVAIDISDMSLILVKPSVTNHHYVWDVRTLTPTTHSAACSIAEAVEYFKEYFTAMTDRYPCRFIVAGDTVASSQGKKEYPHHCKKCSSPSYNNTFFKGCECSNPNCSNYRGQ